MSAKIDYFSSDALRRGLKGKTARGGIVTAVTQLLRIGIGLATIPILARLLTEEDRGLVASVAFFTGFAAMFVDAGLSMATVQRKEITRQQVTNLFWIASGLGALIALVVAFLAPAISWFYTEPRLTAITLAMACSYVFSGLTVQHQALLRRGMQFQRLAAVTVISQVSGQLAGIGWAWSHYDQPNDYWALVLIPLVTAASRLVLTWAVCPWRPGLPRRGAGTRGLVTFGANLTGFSVVNYFSRNVDYLLIGWWWGIKPLGNYEQAYKLFLSPLQLVNTPLSSVMVPALSRLADERQRAQETYLQVLGVLVLFLAPMIAMVAITAEWWVAFVLSPKWIEVAPILRWLAIVALVQPIANSTGWIFISQDKTKQMFRCGLALSPTTVLAFIAGLPWGAEGVAASYAISGLFIRFPLLLYWLGKWDMIQPSRVLGVVSRVAPVAAAVALANGLLVSAWPTASPAAGAFASLAVSLLVGAAAVAVDGRSRGLLTNSLAIARSLRRQPESYPPAE